MPSEESYNKAVLQHMKKRRAKAIRGMHILVRDIELTLEQCLSSRALATENLRQMIEVNKEIEERENEQRSDS